MINKMLKCTSLVFLMSHCYQVAFVKGTNDRQVPFTNKSWRYNAGYLQGVSGVQLKGTHTQEFMSGYINGTTLQ
jgi:hypothetical protein